MRAQKTPATAKAIPAILFLFHMLKNKEPHEASAP
jgi:hypothetical protein